MPLYKVKVKWGRENFQGIEVNTDEEPLLFKAQLYALTGVQPDRQKVMFKGSQLKNNEWNIQLKEGAAIFLLGTKEEVPQLPQEPTMFIEDMNESELATALELPAGLTNLGNTCYMNATVQCLKSVPELREALMEFKDDCSSSSSKITTAIKSVVTQLDKGCTVTPILLLQTLHTAFPQFSQSEGNGTYRQQDANECWSEILKMLQDKLPAKVSEKKYNSFIEQYFGGCFDVEMKCSEYPEEPASQIKENFLQLSCFISPEVKHMHTGLKSKMQEQLTKFSEALGRDAVYVRSSKISRLPAYLTIQFVRFQYKGREGINAKVLKDIKFPIDFDAFELCTPQLQAKLTPEREKLKKLEDENLEKLDEEVKVEKANEKFTPGAVLTSFADDLGSNNSGYYTLQAVLTHKGRSSSSGHYVGWVRQGIDIWMKYDDDVVSPVATEDILRLSGGGDWHCAYVLLYGPRT
ncbi:ubiquitin carboxyl-terminal hydrolase 14 [Episyrphus balteatus]|uniref:ubiquitin carboxyl-terminal hydrolase 14 n=1 Tax=Episyrphus balteatus TaxID=286459 RepID=UPI002485AF6F|nr:ubiquitin carboxyl-terminal hydrolase 14 [Episyrphus balteatus]